jgi:pyruvate formate lyase activating enzyme
MRPLPTAAALVMLALSLAFAAAVAHYPPPSTVSSLAPAENRWVREGSFYRRSCNGAQCNLCPFNCFLPEGARGICKVRINHGGKVRTVVYGKTVSAHLDPIEKKPVFHLLPGSLIYSIAAPGCNLKCAGCQNWEISQIWPEQAPPSVPAPTGLEIVRDAASGMVYGRVKTADYSFLSPSDIVANALATGCKSIAYTYSEPVVFYEYMRDTAALAKKKGLKNVMVSAGYMNREPLLELLPYFDVVKIDLKGFSGDFYRSYSGGDLEPVKNTLLALKEKGKLFEIVNLVVPSLNDAPEDIAALAGWVKKDLGADAPLFFSKFTPNYRLRNLEPTPERTISEARRTAMKAGLKYVYAGNLPGHEGETTYCPKCGRPLVARRGYAVLQDLLTPNGGRCPYDGARVPGVWK